MSALAVALALSLGPAAAGDEPRDGVEPVLRWSGPTECPTEALVLETVSRYVGRSIDDELVRASGTVVREGDGFVLELRIRGAEGRPETRTLRDADCAVLSDVAALMIAVAIDPEAAAVALDEPPADADGSVPDEEAEAEVPAPAEPEVVERAPAVVPEVVAPPAAAEPSETEPIDHDERRRSCRPTAERAGPGRGRPSCWALAVRVVVQHGPLPRVGAGLGGDAALLWPRVRLAAGGTFFFARPARVDADDQLGGDVRLGVGRLRVCGRLGWGTLELPLCGGAELGALRGEGVGVDRPRSDRLPWLAMLADVGLGWSPRRWLATRLELGAAVPVLQQRFAIDGLGVVHEPSAVGLRAALALEWRLP